MQAISLGLEPANGTFEVPFSTGYQTYGGMMSVLDSTNKDVADRLHDSPFSGISNSGLLGRFRMNAEREYHKTVSRNGEYSLHLGITHPDDRETFEALVRAFVIENRNLPLAHGEFTIEGVSTDQTTQSELLDRASAAAEDAAGVRVQFQSTTCRERYPNVWETHPERVSLFQHLAERWNAVADEERMELSPTAESLGGELYTKVDIDEYDTRSIVVYRKEPEQTEDAAIAADGGHLNEAQGFVGEWEFHFKTATKATKIAVIALAEFAQYSGVGRHNARGAGSVATEIIGSEI